MCFNSQQGLEKASYFQSSARWPPSLADSIPLLAVSIEFEFKFKMY